MKDSNRYLTLLCCTCILLSCTTAFGQTHLPPVAQNDSATVIQPYADTINVTANDTSPTGDSFCIKTVYGSRFFSQLDCNQIAFASDSSSFGNDTAWYVICNVNETTLCDTGMIVVAVTRHYTPFMLNNSKWIVYCQQSDCDNGDIYKISWSYYWTTIDTTINGQLYKALYSKEDQGLIYCFGNSSYTIGNPYLKGYLRQDTLDKKVLFLGRDSISEDVIYDFNIGLNDTIYADIYDTSYTTYFDYFKSNDIYYRRININDHFEYLGWMTFQSAWIEGFGSTSGLFNPHGGIGGSELRCFSANGVTIYPSYSPDTCAYTVLGIENVVNIETSIHPNPTTGLCTLQLSENGENYSATVFDITGREVLPLFTNQSGSVFNFNVGSLADGLYFVKVFDANGHVGVSKLVKELGQFSR